MTINNFAGTLFRFSVFAFFIAELASIGGGGGNTDTGDYFACAGSIVLFCALMLFEKEKIHPAAPVCFGIVALSWGLIIQPPILNRCHLTIWLLVIESFHNLLTVDAHASFAWGHRVYGSIVG